MLLRCSPLLLVLLLVACQPAFLAAPLPTALSLPGPTPQSSSTSSPTPPASLTPAPTQTLLPGQLTPSSPTATPIRDVETTLAIRFMNTMQPCPNTIAFKIKSTTCIQFDLKLDLPESAVKPPALAAGSSQDGVGVRFLHKLFPDPK